MNKFITYPVMRYWKTDKKTPKELLALEGYIATVKRDGNWARVIKDSEGKITIQSRTVSKKTGLPVDNTEKVPHLVKAFEDYLPNNTVVLGEIFKTGMLSNEVGSILRCLPAKAIKRQEELGWLEFGFFDCLQYDGKDLTDEPYTTRLEYAKQAYIPLVENVEEMYGIEVIEGSTDEKYEFLLNLWRNGGEGFVLMKETEPYVTSTKSAKAWSSIKIKCETDEELDFVITGVLPPSKEYTGKDAESWQYVMEGVPVTKAYFFGWGGSFEIGAYDKNGKLITIGSISGLTDAQKEHAEEYVGKVVKVKAFSKNDADRTLREPKLVGIHGDKNPKECILEEIFS